MGRDDLATLVLFSSGSRKDVMQLRLVTWTLRNRALLGLQGRDICLYGINIVIVGSDDLFNTAKKSAQCLFNFHYT